MSRRLRWADCPEVISHHLFQTPAILLVLVHEAFFLLELLPQYASLVLDQALQDPGLPLHYVMERIRGLHQKGEMVQEAEEVERLVDAEAMGDSILHSHNLFQFAQGRIDADIHIADVGAGSILRVVYNLLGCILRRAGILGLVVVGIHRS